MLRNGVAIGAFAGALSLAGCASKVVANTSLSMDEFAMTLVGTWTDEGGANYTFEKAGKNVVVSSVVDYDGESFTVVDPGSYSEDGYAWTYSVPSTGYVVTHTIISLTPTQLEARWSNANDSGTSVFDKQ